MSMPFTKPRTKIYTPEEYIGELNLIALERRILIRELIKTQTHKGASELMKCSDRAIADKLYSHQIKESEWKIKKY